MNPALDIANQQGASSGESRFNKILKGDAPKLTYLGGNKGPSKFVVPPMPGGSSPLTHGTFVNDTIRKTGMLPLMYDFALDWVYVYQNIGIGDMSQRMSILAINTVEDDEGNKRIVAEQAWGNGYKSPMCKLQEYLWKASGSPKYNKRQNKVEYTTPVLNPAAADLMPPNSSLDAPMRRATRCLLMQGFVFENAGSNLTIDSETGQPKWPEHRIFLINQVTAINSATHMENKVGIYDKFMMRNQGAITNPADIQKNYGNVLGDVDARMAWEKDTFYHADYATNHKLLELNSKPSGAAGITAYYCDVNNLADIYGPEYRLPDDVLNKVEPIGNYLYKSTEAQQTEWLKELFSGYEWALTGAGIMGETSTAVAVPVQPTEIAAPVTPPVAAPVVAPAAPPVAAPVASPPPAIPVAPSPSAPVTDATGAPLDDQMKAMMDRLNNLNADG
tara:strand:- start:2146 stop:3483 length:1338 start_codon:yes stop_codon:yes gene_type:complete